MQLRHTRLTLALHGQRPATPAYSQLYPERKPLCSRQSQEGVGLRLHRRRLTAAAMQVGRPELGERETIGMSQRLGLGQRLLTPPHGLRWIAQAPQHIRRDGETPHSWRHAVMECQCPLRGWIGAGDTLLEVYPCGGIFTQVEQCAP